MMKRAKAPEFVAKNALDQVPVLESDDGAFLSESIAICRYSRRASHPFSAAMRASRLSWRCGPPRRVPVVESAGGRDDQRRTAIVNPVQFPEYGQKNRKLVAAAMTWLDHEFADGRAWLAGEIYSMADIVRSRRRLREIRQYGHTARRQAPACLARARRRAPAPDQ
jgi:glutathione S-transferase